MGVGQHRRRLALGDLAAEIEHHDPMRDVHDHAHVVLDHHHRHLELLVQVDDVARHVLLLFEVHARHGLVEQDEPRLEGHGAGKLDALAQSVGQGAGRRLAHGLEVEEVDDLLHLPAMLEFLAPGTREPVQGARDEVVPQEVMASHHDVVEDAHVMKQGEVLERPADPQAGPGVGLQPVQAAPAEENLAFRRAIAPGDAVHHGRLAGAVRADDGKELALANGEADVGQSVHTAEAERDAAHLQCVIHAFPPVPSGSRRVHALSLMPRRTGQPAAVASVGVSSTAEIRSIVSFFVSRPYATRAAGERASHPTLPRMIKPLEVQLI